MSAWDKDYIFYRTGTGVGLSLSAEVGAFVRAMLAAETREAKSAVLRSAKRRVLRRGLVWVDFLEMASAALYGVELQQRGGLAGG